MTWLDDLAEASRSVFWSKPGRLKPGEVPRPWPWPAEPSETNLNKGTNTMTHPLDNAIQEAKPLHQFNLDDSNAKALRHVCNEISMTMFSQFRKSSLATIAAICNAWLVDSGTAENTEAAWQLIRDAYDQHAARSNGVYTFDRNFWDDHERLCQCVATIGNIAEEIREKREIDSNCEEITEEIICLGYRVIGWLAHELGKERQANALDLDPIKQRLAEAKRQRPYEEADRHEAKNHAWSDFYQHAPSDIEDLIAEIEQLRKETEK